MIAARLKGLGRAPVSACALPVEEKPKGLGLSALARRPAAAVKPTGPAEDVEV